MIFFLINKLSINSDELKLYSVYIEIYVVNDDMMKIESIDTTWIRIQYDNLSVSISIDVLMKFSARWPLLYKVQKARQQFRLNLFWFFSPVGYCCCEYNLMHLQFEYVMWHLIEIMKFFKAKNDVFNRFWHDFFFVFLFICQQVLIVLNYLFVWKNRAKKFSFIALNMN